MPSTFVHALLPTACVLSLSSFLPKLNRNELLKLALICAFLGNGPDWDVIPAALVGSDWGHIHRQWGHNLFSVLALTGLGVFLFKKVLPGRISTGLCVTLALGLVLSHLVLDSIQDYDSHLRVPGIPLFWPFSENQYYLPLRLFKANEISQEGNFLWNHIKSHDFWSRNVLYEVLGSVMIFGVWRASFLCCAKMVRIWRGQKEKFVVKGRATVTSHTPTEDPPPTVEKNTAI